MKKRFLLRFLIGIVFISSSPNLNAQKISTKELIKKMHDGIAKYRHLRFTLYRSERVDGEQVIGSFNGKLCMDPFMIYIKNMVPNEGSELLYKEGENNNKAWVNPDIFPYITMSFYPESNLLKAGGHHTLKDAGFDLLDEIFRNYEKTYKDELFNYISNKGLVKWNNSNYYKVILNYPDYKIETYRTKENESLLKIAKNKLLNSYKLTELNPSYKENKTIPEGKDITIPNAYAKKFIMYIDSKTFLPLYQEIYDEIGLYEKYVYKNVVFEEQIPKEEFSIDYKEYGF
ncbi:MAG: hypothetical protein CL853_04385 [Crocinitomicaceae bacterium]|nr:hypothetical protein [Crocinitomicaceae bacterium]|tara:strand:- start:989 stop:1849 length:861 start_codon:yes stop_codon:yes gene_type:complete